MLQGQTRDPAKSFKRSAKIHACSFHDNSMWTPSVLVSRQTLLRLAHSLEDSPILESDDIVSLGLGCYLDLSGEGQEFVRIVQLARRQRHHLFGVMSRDTSAENSHSSTNFRL